MNSTDLHRLHRHPFTLGCLYLLAAIVLIAGMTLPTRAQQLGDLHPTFATSAIMNTNDSGRPGLPRADELAAAGSCADGWRDGLPVNGVDGNVQAIALDGAGNIYVGGSFTGAGNKIVNNIAKWDGSSWSALGTGLNDSVSSIAVSGTDVYAAGWFTTAGGTPANYIAKWNGSNWSPVGSGLEYPAQDIETSGPDIYVGGGGNDNGTQVGYVAKWNSSIWSNLGSGMDGSVSDIGVSGSDVYAAGNFTSAGGTPANHIAKWNGSNWSALGVGPNGYVSTIALSGTDLIAGGSRNSGPNGSIGFVSKWNGSNWIELGSGMTDSPRSSAYVSRLATLGTDIYVTGLFNSAGGTPANGFAKWNGSRWLAAGPDGIGYAGAIVVVGNNVVVYGTTLLRWNGSNWSTVGSTETVSQVNALTVSGTDVYAGGYFTTDAGATFSRAAVWNGSGWTRVGSWPQDPIWTGRNVMAVAATGKNVYVGGLDGTQYQLYVAKWDGSSWSTLVSGVSIGYRGDVLALAASGSDLYVGGDFTTIEGIAVNGIVKWNGSGWSSLGTGMGGYVSALAISGKDVYAGGAFGNAGGIPAFMMAKWNGTNWSALGSGPFTSSNLNRPQDVDLAVRDIEVSGTDVYAAGGVDDNYGTGLGFVSKWNGSTWTQLPKMCCSPVYNIAVSGSDVYAGGWFNSAGGTPTNYIAKWNGSAWSPLGSGTNNPVSAISVRGADLFVGGSFTTAGCHVSAYFARYSLSPAVAVSVSGRVTTPDGRGLRNATIYLTDALGHSFSVVSSSLGFYSFDGVTPGQTYSISVQSKRYRFSGRQVQVSQTLTGVDLIAVE